MHGGEWPDNSRTHWGHSLHVLLPGCGNQSTPLNELTNPQNLLIFSFVFFADRLNIFGIHFSAAVFTP
jgi:hypothetical protein